MTIHIMLDLETWGTRPGCDIRSIGACVFDPATGWVAGDNDGMDDGGIDQMHTFYIACDNPWMLDWTPQSQKYPLHRDPRTVQWWSEQSDEAQAAFADPVDLREALDRFKAWMYGVTRINREETGNSNACIWSHGAAFDPPILAAAYEAVGLPVPWHYRAPRDTRTLFDLADVTDHSAWLAQHPGPLGLTHHALDDAICQARAVCAAYKRIGQ